MASKRVGKAKKATRAKPSKVARRPSMPDETATQVIARFRRRCPLCFGLHGDSEIKQGQIAHLDGNRENNRPTNLAFLCLAHHDSYDSITSQSRGIGRAEVSIYTTELKAYLGALGAAAWPDTPPLQPQPNANVVQLEGIPLSVFDRRVPVYRLVRQFLYKVVERPGVELKELLAFASETDEALFLFDDLIAAHIREIYVAAVNLRAVLQRIHHCQQSGLPIPPDLLDKDAELLMWFSGQVERWRQIICPYLRIASKLQPN